MQIQILLVSYLPCSHLLLYVSLAIRQSYHKRPPTVTSRSGLHFILLERHEMSAVDYQQKMTETLARLNAALARLNELAIAVRTAQ